MKSKNVTSAKPRIEGAIFRAPIGTALPADAISELDPAFKELGFIGEDGLTNDNSADSDSVKAWGGATVLTIQKEKKDEFKLQLLEVLNTDVLSTVYGSGNVKGTLKDGITISANAKELESGAYVFDMILKGNIAKRIVVPEGKISEIGEVTYQDGDAVQYEITLTALPDSNGNTHYEYIKQK
jgi:hypothetical protein|nr:MAG TPA: tail protein [Caudoviricetes sp.]